MNDNEPEIDNSEPTSAQLLGFVLGAASIAVVVFLLGAYGIPFLKDQILLSDAEKCYEAGYSATTDNKTNKIKCIPRFPRPNDDVVLLRRVCEQYRVLDTTKCETEKSEEWGTTYINCKPTIKESCYEEPY